MTIQIHGKERMIMICTDGEKCSVIETNGANMSMWCGIAMVCAEEDSTKGKTIETIEKYDKDGNLVEKIVREIPENSSKCSSHAIESATTAKPSETYG